MWPQTVLLFSSLVISTSDLLPTFHDQKHNVDNRGNELSWGTQMASIQAEPLLTIQYQRGTVDPSKKWEYSWMVTTAALSVVGRWSIQSHTSMITIKSWALDIWPVERIWSYVFFTQVLLYLIGKNERFEFKHEKYSRFILKKPPKTNKTKTKNKIKFHLHMKYLIWRIVMTFFLKHAFSNSTRIIV